MKRRIKQVAAWLGACVMALTLMSTKADADYIRPNGSPMWWSLSTGTSVIIYYVNVNISTSTGDNLNMDNIIGGMQYWKDGITSAYGQVKLLAATTDNLPSIGWVMHSVPTENNWTTFAAAFDVTSVRYTEALTVPYNANKQDIYYHLNDSDSISCAAIYYNPYINFNGTRANGESYGASYTEGGTTVKTAIIKSIVAHETGHAIGFGHTINSTSIMIEENVKKCGISDYDKNEFKTLYSMTRSGK